ncbi:MAG: hypothetical protein D3X82_04225 [Candidatus Leucobacter sulfamidivorax]|nr:hypothetical protein [Candidatus Leucobacter sulfamidivorax]
MTSSSPDVHPRSRIAWIALVIVLVVEVVGGLAVLIPVVQGFFGATGDPIEQRLSIFLSALIAWVWVIITLWGALRSRASWVRGSAITIHILLFAAGTGVLQFGLAEPLVGWMLILLAFAGFAAALIARPMVREPEEG